MKKPVALTLAVMMVLALLSGCAGSSKTDAARPREEAAAEDVYVESPALMENGVTMDSASQSGSSIPDTDQKLIKTVRMDVETEDMEALLPQISEKINALGGYVEEQELYNGSS